MKRALNFMNKALPITYNTAIGGVSATINTPALLATKLGITVGRITNFTIVGSDIKCKITGSYAIPANSFYFNSTPCTYYIDSDYLVTSIGNNAFYAVGSFNGYDADFQNCITVGASAFGVNCKRILLPNATSLGNACFYYGTPVLETIYIPRVTTMGTDVGMQDGAYQRVFLLSYLGLPMSLSNVKIYAHPSMATINAGGVEGDLAYAISRGATVRYVTNFTAPNPVTTLATGTVYNTAIQLNFTPPSSTNTIEYYECYANGVYKNTITASGQYITGLSPSTSYVIEVLCYFYNTSFS